MNKKQIWVIVVGIFVIAVLLVNPYKRGGFYNSPDGFFATGRTDWQVTGNLILALVVVDGFIVYLLRDRNQAKREDDEEEDG